MWVSITPTLSAVPRKPRRRCAPPESTTPPAAVPCKPHPRTINQIDHAGTHACVLQDYHLVNATATHRKTPFVNRSRTCVRNVAGRVNIKRCIIPPLPPSFSALHAPPQYPAASAVMVPPCMVKSPRTDRAMMPVLAPSVDQWSVPSRSRRINMLMFIMM